MPENSKQPSNQPTAPDYFYYVTTHGVIVWLL